MQTTRATALSKHSFEKERHTDAKIERGPRRSHRVGATPDSSAHTTCTLAITNCPYDLTYNPDKPKHQGGTVVFSGMGGFPQTLNPALASP